ncbi:MAG: putative lipid II flippase FtsW [Bdellovibrionaceae bacterium]|nr:putative lipid II flippase FtsW [Pseudobdellovibrionaceae bacterium]
MISMPSSESRNIALIVFSLLGFGLIQVYSSSYIFAYEKYGNGFYFFARQFAFVAIGLSALISLWKMPTRWIEEWGVYLAPIAIIALFLTIVPGIGVKVGGAKRWLPGLMGVRIEPCEIYKIALPFLLAAFFAYDQEKLGRWKWVVRATALGAPLLVFILQPDFGSFTMCLLVIATVVFVFGFPWKYLAAVILATLPLFYFLVISVPYRRARIAAFLDPWQDPTGKGFQVIQSMLTFHSGGLGGTGLGDGQGKLYFLPEAHTDFTLAVLGEETGFIGFFVLMCAYGYLVLRGLQISNRVESLFLRVLSLALTVCFAYSVFINVGVVLGLLPTKGLTLPFLSYGGASLVMSCVLFGILLNINKQCRNS